MPRRSRSAEAGFSLLEVLVAFVVAALVVGAALQVFAGGARNVKLAADYYEAVRIAESRIAEVGVAVAVAAGEYEGAWNDYDWALKIEPLANPAELPADLFVVTAEVRWGADPRKRTYTLATLRQAPPEAP